MVQRTNAACGGRESVSVMKGEVVSSILTGSTILFSPIISSKSAPAANGICAAVTGAGSVDLTAMSWNSAERIVPRGAAASGERKKM